MWRRWSKNISISANILCLSFLLALFFILQSVQLNKQNLQIIRQAISEFMDEPSCPFNCHHIVTCDKRWIGIQSFKDTHPLAQLPFLFNELSLICHICQNDGVISNLIGTNNWRDGHNTRNLPRLIYTVYIMVTMKSQQTILIWWGVSLAHIYRFH